MLALDGYIRVSKVGGRSGESFIAPDTQRDAITGWAARHDARIVAWHEDLDQSGGTIDRPGFQAALARIEAGAAQGIVVPRLDRFGRSVPRMYEALERIQSAGGQVISVAEDLDFSTAGGKAHFNMLAMIAQYQRDQITDGWKVATERAISKGIHTKVPFGYTRGPDRRLVPDGTATLVEDVFRRRIAGESWARLARFLDEHVTPPRGDQWTRRGVENIVRNRVYLGEARYGTNVNPAAHEAIVDEQTWRAAQAARAAPREHRGVPALLSGLARCAGCRHRMRAATVGERRQLVYRCDRIHGAGACPAPASVRRDLLDEYVTDVFLEHYGAMSRRVVVADTALLDAQQRLADAEREVVAYRDNTKARELLAGLGGDLFEEGLEQRVRAVLEARREVDALVTSEHAVHLGENLDVWDALDVPGRRLLLTEGIDAVFLRRIGRVGRAPAIDADRVRVLWRGQAPDDLPGPGLRVELRSFDW